MPTAHVSGVSLEYVESGAGEAVVFVHGALSDYRIWDAQRNRLGQDYRAIAYSCRHHWPNTPAPPDGDNAFVQHANDLAELIDALDAAPAHLVGNSSGGLICLFVAARNPALVRTLTLIEPFLLPLLMNAPPKPLDFFKVGIRHPRTALAIAHFGAKGLAPALAAYERGEAESALQIFATAVLGPGGTERMTEAQLAQARDNNFVQQFAGTMPRLDAGAVRDICAPTLLLCAEQSPRLFHHFANRLHEHMPHAKRGDIPNASHTPQVDNPTAVTEAILAFLGDQAGA